MPIPYVSGSPIFLIVSSPVQIFIRLLRMLVYLPLFDGAQLFRESTYNFWHVGWAVINTLAMHDGGNPTDDLPSYPTMDTNSISPSRTENIPLPIPFCLPQVSAKYNSPFGRGYNELLDQVGISAEEWLKFVDDLNIAMAGFPPLIILDAAGMALGFVPHHWFQLISAGIQVAAGVGQRVATKGLMEHVLHHANEETFNPRGLVVHICTTRALRAIVQGGAIGMERLKRKEKMKDFGDRVSSGAEEFGLILGIGKNSAKHPVDPDISPFNRHLALMSPHILPVSTDVPPAEKLATSAILDKTSAMTNKIRIWRTKKAQEKANKHRRMLAIAEGRLDDLRQPSSSDASEHSNRSKRREQRAIKKAIEARNDSKKLEKMQGKVRRLDRIDELRDDRLLWIVLMNAEQSHVLVGSPASSIHVNFEETEGAEEHESHVDEARVYSDLLEAGKRYDEKIPNEKRAP